MNSFLQIFLNVTYSSDNLMTDSHPHPPDIHRRDNNKDLALIVRTQGVAPPFCDDQSFGPPTRLSSPGFFFKTSDTRLLSSLPHVLCGPLGYTRLLFSSSQRPFLTRMHQDYPVSLRILFNHCSSPLLL
ncbi:hypothetical protein PNOK_0335900 [Pyrrhoderma noxium]|uniref:Uncharacterized protein n=1 Tax=Pyrrhoderma noxium TaxID=2282107 RepID=A0A286UME0_9AGAM|nr:hypothetical protein PNOK_0335900 [Pyrrhoderma noxium]